MLHKVIVFGQFAVFLVISLAVFLIVGLAISRLWEKESSVCTAIVSGFVSCLAIYQVLAIPFILKKGSLSILTGIYAVIILLICGYGIWAYLKKKIWIKKIKVSGIKIISILLMLGIGFMSSYLYSVESDDCYYVGVSTYAYERDTICLDQTEISTGMDYVSATPRPMMSAWEIFLASCSRLTRLEPVILAHSLVPIWIILLAYCACFQMAELFFKGKEKDWFVLFFFVLVLFSGYSKANVGSFLLMRAWQGKTVFVAVVLPAFLAGCYRMVKEEQQRWWHWFYNAVVLIAGICCTVVGIYLGPLLYLMIALAYLLVMPWSRVKKAILPAVCSVIPIGAIALYSLFSVTTGSGQSYVNAEAESWNDIFNMFWNVEEWNAWVFLVTFAISIIFIYKTGKREDRILFFWTPLLTIGILLNPLLQPFIAQKITGVDVYWRVYWLLPVYITIPYMLTKLRGYFEEEKSRTAIGIVICVLITFSGKNVFLTEDYFQMHKSLHRIPMELVNISEYLLTKGEGTVVLTPIEFSEQLRQYTSFLLTPYSREIYNGERELETQNTTLESAYKNIYHGNMRNPYVISRTLKELGVEYLVLPEELELRDSDLMVEDKEIDQYIIYKVAY